jgi:predicted Rossmann fold nucleotide-binding protein DprA/Smf involved in DNA uptake
MACPGDATRRAAQGSNRLLAEGAILIQTAEDVLAGLRLEPAGWERIRVESVGRTATGPDGTAATLRDNVIWLRKVA